ncbi:hypothetical protein DLJ58_03690 [Micromonospora arida]|uniref:Uncharacterized protein n=1 Tax=Micromonospora arida TaxID=2203715 RepID=A0A3N9Y0Y7_9ACTN|nr:hypothetical protein DLJ58_03690 [Micromonospora arida]
MMVGEEDAPARVPVDAGAWRWPVRADRIECGECSERMPVAPLTALTEIADALAEHTRVCRAFS